MHRTRAREIGKFILLCYVNPDLQYIRWHMRQFMFLPVHAHNYGNIKFRREDNLRAHTCNVWPIESVSDFCESGNPPASGEICARAFDALLQAIMPSGHLSLKYLCRKRLCLKASIDFFYSLKGWRTSCYSVGGARALDEVRFIPLSWPRSRHQPKNLTPLILTTAYRMHTKVNFCV